MISSSLDTLATHLAAHLGCIQDGVCRQIMRSIAETGQPLALADLARRLQMRREILLAHLARVPDTEFDAQGNIVGWGITLAPTHHQFRLKGRSLFTWCAFDTVLFPPLLQIEAHIQSVCETSGQPLSFVASPQDIREVFPATSVLSLILPDARGDCVRETFCRQSLFFQTEEAASPWMAFHPGAMLLSVEKAAALGQIIVETWANALVAESREVRGDSAGLL